MTRQDLRSSEHAWREYSRRVNPSNAHRVLRTCKEIAPDVIGGLLLIPLVLVITFSLAIGVELLKGVL